MRRMLEQDSFQHVPSKARLAIWPRGNLGEFHKIEMSPI